MPIPLWLFVALVLAANLAAFIAYGIDKTRARRDQWRISESRLLWLGVPLAAPGMIAGMRVFRHKLRKGSFVLRASLVVAANVAMIVVLGWLLWHGWLKLV